jgi:hypothetical protein
MKRVQEPKFLLHSINPFLYTSPFLLKSETIARVGWRS